jgi:flagellar hook-length control protein FliK
LPSLAVTTIARNTAPQAAKTPAQEAASADASPFTRLLNEATSRQEDKSHTQTDGKSPAAQASEAKAARPGERKTHDKKDSDAKNDDDDKDTGVSAQLTPAPTPPPATTPPPQPDPNAQTALQVAMTQQNGQQDCTSQTGDAADDTSSSDGAVPALQAASAANAPNISPGDDADDAAVQPQQGNQPAAQGGKAAAPKPQTGKPETKTAANAPGNAQGAAPSDAEDAFKTLLHGNKDGAAQDNAKQGDAQPRTADAANTNAAPGPQAVAAPQPMNTAPNQAAISAASGTTPAAGNNSPPVGANPSATASVHVAAQTSTPNVGAMAVEIAARSQAGAKQFDIRLDPPELGRVEVRLSIDATGKAQAHMTADQPQTLSLLQKDAPNLTRALRDAGLDVSQSGLNFSLKGQDHQSNDGGKFQPQARGNSLLLTASKTIDAVPTAASFTLSGNGRLDIHV